MATKWADVEEDDYNEVWKNEARFETEADEHGIRMITEYIERDGQTVKVARKVKQTTKIKRINLNVEKRREELKKFGKEASGLEGDAADTRVIEEAISIEPIKRVGGGTSEEYDKFLEEEAEALMGKKNKPGGIWNKFRANREAAEEGGPPTAGGAVGADGRDADGKYIPPSLRRAMGGDSMMASRLAEQKAREELTLRVTNLSEDVREGDLQDLFGVYGRLQRVFLAKNLETKESKGFAFITYYTRFDAELAIKKLHGHGYDNLILNVQFAKPRPDGPPGR